jgi:geranylgeranyl diphosphate synthase type II
MKLIFFLYFGFMNSASELKLLVNESLEKIGFSSQKPENLYAPMDYLLSLGGKRIRPILCMLAYASVSGRKPAEALKVGLALELFHNFTLMHDDIMDRAPVRRGKPSVHTVWNEDVAILSGDALFAYAMGLLVEDFPTQAAALVKEFAAVSLEVCEGQMEDMDLAEQADADIPLYLEMIRKKTAALLGGCMSLGAMAANADEDIRLKFKAFGENLGLGFQLQDDLMDAFPPEGFGKQVGGDIIENKKTFLLLKALELADGEQKAELERLLSEEKNNEQKVSGVLQIMRTLEIPRMTRELIDAYFEKAIQLAHELAESTRFDELQAYLEVIAKRKF